MELLIVGMYVTTGIAHIITQERVVNFIHVKQSLDGNFKNKGGKQMQNLNCVNSWCKYKDGFYCMCNCGSYIKSGTKFCEIDKTKINAKNLFVFDLSTNADLANGEFDEVFFNSSEFQNREIKEAHYDACGSSTFIIGL